MEELSNEEMEWIAAILRNPQALDDLVKSIVKSNQKPINTALINLLRPVNQPTGTVTTGIRG